jgi:sugar porter (SP) family MFS transporter
VQFCIFDHTGTYWYEVTAFLQIKKQPHMHFMQRGIFATFLLDDFVMTRHFYVLFVCVTAALGGFLFGFDTAVISGANLFIQPYFDLTDWQFGGVVSSMLLGCAFGAAIAGKPGDLYGRKTILLITAVMFGISAVGSALANSVAVFVLYRLIGGIAVGSASMMAPVYISEIAPAHLRGRLVSLNQLTIVLGISAAFWSNHFLSGLPEEVGWRWMLGVEAIPAGVFLLLLFTVPESPRWLMMRGQTSKARRFLMRILSEEEALRAELEIREKTPEHGKKISFFSLVRKPYSRIVGMGVVLAIMQQVTGINIVMYYAPNIFKSIGLENASAIYQTVSVGLVMTLFTVVSMFFVDRVGRKPLIVYGGLGMFLFLAVLSSLFFTDNVSGAGVLISILGYIACFSFSLGPVVWVLISELFPNEIRGIGVAFATFFLWMANYVVTLTFPVLLHAFEGPWRGGTFLIYAVFCLIMVVYTSLKVPETAGKTLEEVGAEGRSVAA